MSECKLNIRRILEKVADIRESVDFLSRYASLSDEDFLTDHEAIRAARYSFIVIAEAATNIATHICARVLKKAPATYVESFLLLAEHKLIDADLAKRLGQMVGFRNLLVHGYNRIDDRIMLKIMRSDLEDLELFIDEILRLAQITEE